MTNALDRMAGGADDNSAQGNHLVTARCLTTSNQRIDGETETFIPVTSIRLNQTQSWGDPVREDEVETLEGSQGMKQAVGAAQGVRRLTPVECERLQGFPDDWTAIDGPATPDSRRYAAMGDAVTVNVAAWIGERLARYGA